MAEREYERLTRSAARARFAVISAERCSLWLGKDHVLSIDTNGYRESYKRFYFRDIQAVIIRQTDYGKIAGLALGVVAGLLGLFAFLSGHAGHPVLAYIQGVVAALLAAILVLNLAGGPTCTCQLRTAVQVEELPSLGRLRRARRVLARLRPLIAQAQGELAPGEAPARSEPEQEGGSANPTTDGRVEGLAQRTDGATEGNPEEPPIITP
ncbi:conserved hypothetical protein [Verrucomicrobia bacterium]|nr:conserved hypothetical protein [Verrucomicrobiota bacterium]